VNYKLQIVSPLGRSYQRINKYSGRIEVSIPAPYKNFLQNPVRFYSKTFVQEILERILQNIGAEKYNFRPAENLLQIYAGISCKK
jgi:hypothetical protein